MAKAAKSKAKDETAGVSAEEHAARKERAKEVARGGGKEKDDEADLLAKIAEMDESDRVLAEGIHALVKAHAPDLAAKTWYGMPAYAKVGKVVFFFQAASKFETRYATLGFNDAASLDDGAMWPTAFALTRWNAAVKERVTALVKQAAG